MLDTVEVLSHNSFAALLKRAKALLEETLGDRVEEASVVVNPRAGVRQAGTPLTKQGELPVDFSFPASGEVQIQLPGPAATDPEQGGLFELDEDDWAAARQTPQQHVGLSLATLDSRVATAAASTEILTRTLKPRMPGGLSIPLFLPQVTTKWQRDPFSLSSIHLTDVEALGRQFANDDAPVLLQKMIDAERTEDGLAHVRIHDATYTVRASQTAMPFGDIETDLEPVGRAGSSTCPPSSHPARRGSGSPTTTHRSVRGRQYGSTSERSEVRGTPAVRILKQATHVQLARHTQGRHIPEGTRVKPRPNTLLATAALLLAATVVAGPADADSSTPGGGYTAPAPTKVDRAGTDQDEYCIPDEGLGDLYTVYLVDGQYAPPLKCHPTNGATQVHITTEQDHGTWTFDYSTDTGPAPAADSFAVNFGECFHDPVDQADTHRLATLTMTNTGDAGMRYIRALAASVATDYSGAAISKSYVTRLEDGASFTVELFKRELDGSPDLNSGLKSDTVWTFTVSRSDLRDTIWDSGARPYVVFEQDILVPSCRMTRVKRGYSKTQITITAQDYWNAPDDRRFRIRLVNRRGKTVYRQPVTMRTGETRTITLKKSALSKRALAKGIPDLRVEHYDAHATYHNGHEPPTHWGIDYGGVGNPTAAWKTRKR